MRQSLKSVALVGTYLPRKCGIATFTSDLAATIIENDARINCPVLAMNDRPEGYEYPETVLFQINQDILHEYTSAADFLNVSDVDVVCLQHEYGIFGGNRGSFIIELLKNLKMPVVTTLHTILKDPPSPEYRTMKQISELSDRLVVMSERAAEFLRELYQVPESKISLIHHGFPDVPFLDPDPCKSKFVADDKIMILTFGLLSPNKGIEYMVDALPDIVGSHPEVLYFVVGMTHPHLKAESGEGYRLGLQLQAKELGVADNIVFFDRFLDRDDLVEIIRAADIYVIPSLNEAQIVSGTLTYALGAGKAIVSTPFWHAQEMLANGRGRLVPFKDHKALAQAVIDLLDHPEERAAMRRRAYRYCRPMVRTEMGRRYLEIFAEAKAQRLHETVDLPPLDTLGDREQRLPPINLRHLRLMTDGTGMLQHAKFTVPNRAHGYCVDDNARALIVATLAHVSKIPDTSLMALSSIYLSFLDDAFNPETARFRNFMSYERKWLEEVGSEDSQGRALWALGVVAAWGRDRGQVAVAINLFDVALAAVDSFVNSRAIAFAILGIQAYLRHNDDHRVRGFLPELGDRLRNRFRKHATGDWHWYEDMLTYDNARLPQALIACGRATQDNDMVSTGIYSLEWLTDIQLDQCRGWFTPVGNEGWFPRSGTKAHYDQQPLEAAAMIDACIEAHECTQDDKWIQSVSTCFNWYLGKNDRQISLYDHATGGCRDGLQHDGVNENQGAESTLSWISSLLAIYNLRGLTTLRIRGEEQTLEDNLPAVS